MIIALYIIVLALAGLLIWKPTYPAAPFCGFILIIAVLLVATGHCQTRLVAFPDTVILRRGNFIISATTDGYLCYGTRTPLAVSCHKAVTKPW